MKTRNGLNCIKAARQIVLMVLFASSCRAFAQTTTGSISFQAALNGPNGASLPDNSYALTFKFYNAATGGTALATSNVPNVPVINGIGSAVIPVDPVWFDGQTLYMGIAIDAGEELKPRTIITAVPYAIGASQLIGTGLSADPATGGLLISYPDYQPGEAEYFRIRHASIDGRVSSAMSSHFDAEMVFGKVDGFDPDWTHGSYIGFKTTPNNRDLPPSESFRIVPDGIRLLYDSYQAGSAEYSGIRHEAVDGRLSGPDAHHPDAEITFGKVDGFDPDWTHGSYISFKTTPNNRDVAPTEQLRVAPDAVQVNVLRITGGADLAEHINIDCGPPSRYKVEPGMVVSIDSSGNRKFKLSDEPYDRKRVGIISGGNGVKPGLVLRDEGNPQADGDQPIALTGQVWCHADASFGEISPGDLLTTSETPGHAMRVSDDSKARFAVLGQALTGLKEGRGWVQVLVGRQ